MAVVVDGTGCSVSGSVGYGSSSETSEIGEVVVVDAGTTMVGSIPTEFGTPAIATPARALITAAISYANQGFFMNDRG